MTRIKAMVVAMVMAALLLVTGQAAPAATAPAAYCGDVQVALLYAEYSLFNCRAQEDALMRNECLDAVYSIINALQNELVTCDPILQ